MLRRMMLGEPYGDHPAYQRFMRYLKKRGQPIYGEDAVASADLVADILALDRELRDDPRYDRRQCHTALCALAKRTLPPPEAITVAVAITKPIDSLHAVFGLVGAVIMRTHGIDCPEADVIAAEALTEAYLYLKEHEYELGTRYFQMQDNVVGALLYCGEAGFDRLEELGISRDRLVRAWGMRGSKRGAADLAKLAQDGRQSDEVRLSALTRLAGLSWERLEEGERRVLREGLIGFLAHEDWGYRRRAAQVSGRVPDAALIPHLERLRTGDPQVREVYRTWSVAGERIEERGPVYEVREAAAVALDQMRKRIEAGPRPVE